MMVLKYIDGIDFLFIFIIIAFTCKGLGDSH